MTDLVSKLMDFEAGQLEEDEIIEMFQELIDTGTAWTLQGSYGRCAQALIDQGLCVERMQRAPRKRRAPKAVRATT